MKEKEGESEIGQYPPELFASIKKEAEEKMATSPEMWPCYSSLNEPRRDDVIDVFWKLHLKE